MYVCVCVCVPLYKIYFLSYTVISFLQIYITIHLNLTLNYTVHVANCFKNLFHLILYIEMFRKNPLKSQVFSS